VGDFRQIISKKCKNKETIPSKIQKSLIFLIFDGEHHLDEEHNDISEHVDDDFERGRQSVWTRQGQRLLRSERSPGPRDSRSIRPGKSLQTLHPLPH